ncbi:MAG: plasmid pRiA4b ORF-3 family protein [bacterium]|nr:plasmid pRiA4b ORF-3 family protein [bacterium]
MTTSFIQYQILVTLNESDPPIWRRLIVPSTLSLGDMQNVLQFAMGWHNSHLHKFVTMQGEYGPVGFGLGLRNEQSILLSDVLISEETAIVYQYDFGDCWEHLIILEKIMEDSAGKPAIRCIAGERACPPEDCGGIIGYTELLDIIGDDSHPEHASILEWLGGPFDPDHFDLAAVNRKLAKIKPASQAKRTKRKSRKQPDS